MRISIRRCLSMLRNTSDGNELAVPATNALQEHSVDCWCTVMAGLLDSLGYSRYYWLACITEQ